MADAKKCDRCGKYFDVGSFISLHSTEEYPNFYFELYYSNNDEVDLCNKCHTSLVKWFNRKGVSNEEDKE
jgi:hypothetical protein